ncbi:hypothetical protein KM043_016474 [Ampulex compressa]|nr:hypothetical protein KM043_016474 [Ampulex compressa]
MGKEDWGVDGVREEAIKQIAERSREGKGPGLGGGGGFKKKKGEYRRLCGKKKEEKRKKWEKRLARDERDVQRGEEWPKRWKEEIVLPVREKEEGKVMMEYGDAGVV